MKKFLSHLATLNSAAHEGVISEARVAETVTVGLTDNVQVSTAVVSTVDGGDAIGGTVIESPVLQMASAVIIPPIC